MSYATQNPFQHTVHRASLLPLTPIYFDFALFIVILPVLCVGADSRFGDSLRGRSCLLQGLQCYSVSGQCGERTSFNQVLCCWSNKSDTGGPSINNVINSLPSPLFWLKSQNILRSNVFQFFIIFFTYLHEVNIVQVLQPPESSMAISDLYDDTKCCFLKQLGFINF